MPRQSPVAEQSQVLPDLRPFRSETSSSDASVAERPQPFPVASPDLPDLQVPPKDSIPGTQDVAAGRWVCAAVHPEAEAAHCTSVAAQFAASRRAAAQEHSQRVLQELPQSAPQREEQQAPQLDQPQREQQSAPKPQEQQPQASPPPAQPEAQPLRLPESSPQAAEQRRVP